MRAPSRLLLLTTTLVALFACSDEEPLQPGDGAFALQLVAQGLVSPLQVVEPPDGSGRLFVLDQIGRIRVVDPSGNLLAEPFLDLTARMVSLNGSSDERGLLGLAFHPSYATNRRFYVYYSAPLRAGAPSGWNHTSHVSEFQASSDPVRATPTSERIVMQIDQPQSNHNGGALTFGPDGFLYVALGDGGAGNDVGTGHVAGGNGQSLAEPLGSILRIDVNGAAPYSVPASNPFMGRTDARPEIWAYGFRNPYRFSFDRSNGDLIAGDVGQSRWEEVDVVVRGGNYGWNRREGAQCFQSGNPSCATTGAMGEPLLDPVLQYANAATPGGGVGTAVVGGYVYRGGALPELAGRYLFGDFTSGSGSLQGQIWFATPRSSAPWDFQPLPFGDRPNGNVGHHLKGFGEDAEGELYLATSDQIGPSGTSGRVYRLVRHTP